jgi:acetolactate synthase-1/3 small subunit
VETDDGGAARLEAHLYKLLNVLHVQNVTKIPAVFRDLAMIKVTANHETRAGLIQLAMAFRAHVVDVGTESLILEVTGTEDKIDSLLEVLRPYGVVETVRTGRVAMARGPHSLAFGGPQPQLDLSSWDDDRSSVYQA